ncbi:unnamed protein product [Cunninghamella echinulata]
MANEEVSTDPLIHQIKGINSNYQSEDELQKPLSLETNQRDQDQDQEQEKMGKKMLRKQILMFSLMLLIDIGAPLALYYILKNYTSELIALVISGVPPLLHVLVSFIYKRRIEVIGCICIFSFILSAVLTLISGDARIALLRDSFTTLVISLAFLLTLIPIRTRWIRIYPLTFLVMQQMMSELPPIEWYDDVDGIKKSLPRPEFLWNYMPIFPKYQYISTLVWGSCLLLEFVIKVILIEATSLSVDQIYIYGTISVAVLISSASVCSISLSIHLRKKSLVFINEWKKNHDYLADQSV